MSKNYPNWSNEDSPFEKGYWRSNPEEFMSDDVPCVQSFSGTTINSKDYVFQKGKYKGLTVEEMARLHPKVLNLFMLHERLYIFSFVIDSFQNVPEANCRMLRRTIDSFLKFEPITEEQPYIISYAGKSLSEEFIMLKKGCYDPEMYGFDYDDFENLLYTSCYEGELITDVVKKDLGYLSTFVEKGNEIDEKYLTKLRDNEPMESIKKSYDAALSYLWGMEELRSAQEEDYKSWVDGQYEQQMLHDMIDDGYKSAYEGDPDAQWNTD